MTAMPEVGIEPLKQCRDCEETKPLGDFYPRRRVCKRCTNARTCAWAKANRAEHTARTRAWQIKNPDKALSTRLKVKYGITLDEFRAMLKAQGGVCAICAGPCVTEARLSVDHCHETGQIRGLLCRVCNSVLGLMADDPERLRRAADYLDRHKED